jgi:MFS family permease
MMTAASGTVPAAAIDVIHPGLRATGAAMVAVVQNLFGLAAGPLITGVLSDTFGLVTALTIMPVFCLASAAVLMVGTRFYAAELNAARTLAAMTMQSDQGLTTSYFDCRAAKVLCGRYEAKVGIL